MGATGGLDVGHWLVARVHSPTHAFLRREHFVDRQERITPQDREQMTLKKAHIEPAHMTAVMPGLH